MVHITNGVQAQIRLNKLILAGGTFLPAKFCGGKVMKNIINDYFKSISIFDLFFVKDRI
jgi:hypothetical protein